MEKQAEKHTATAPAEHGPSHALQEAIATYKVCKDSTVVIPPNKCPEEYNHIDFSAKI